MRGKSQGSCNLIETSCILPLCHDVVLLLIVEDNNANSVAYAVQTIHCLVAGSDKHAQLSSTTR
jgi:hypothetical protein